MMYVGKTSNAEESSVDWCYVSGRTSTDQVFSQPQDSCYQVITTITGNHLPQSQACMSLFIVLAVDYKNYWMVTQNFSFKNFLSTEFWTYQ